MTSTSPTPSAGPATQQSVRADLDEAATAIGAARTLLEQGTVIDLSGLETQVGRACEALNQLDVPDRMTLKPALISLMDSLNALTDELTRQHAELSATLQDLGNRRQALNAYGPQKRR